MLISILGNASVLAAIIRTPSIGSTSMIMLCSLAVSDLLVGVIAQPLFMVNELTKTNVLFPGLGKTTVTSLCGVSLGTITAITVDRFMALHYHMRYAILVTETRVKCTVATIWLITFNSSCVHFWNERALDLLNAVSISICLIISTFSYIKIYLIVRQHQRQIHIQQQAVQNSILGNNLNVTQMRRSAINTSLFYIVLILCYFLISIFLAFSGVPYNIWKTKWKFASTIVFMNSSINPFLYCWRLREIRRAVIETARQMLCKQTDQD